MTNYLIHLTKLLKETIVFIAVNIIDKSVKFTLKRSIEKKDRKL
jgi:hypothetical protein